MSYRATQEEVQHLICLQLTAHRCFFLSLPRVEDPGSRLKKSGYLHGAEALLVVHRGRAHFISVKTKTGRLAPSQKDFRDDCRDRGILWGLARSVEDVEKLLKNWGITR